MRAILPAVLLSLAAQRARAQGGIGELFLQDSVPLGEGWAGFTDFGFMANATLTLTLAAVLGAILAYHPKLRATADTRSEIEAPKVYITYSVIGALIGIMVVKYGLIVGFVLFGIGGLMRFRTLLGNASLTGQAIFVTLIGLSCGLDLPNVAVLATAFGYVLIYILDSKITYSIDIQAIPADRCAEAAQQYRSVLEQEGCRILREKKTPAKQRLRFVFRSRRPVDPGRLEHAFDEKIDPAIRGSVDWELD